MRFNLLILLSILFTFSIANTKLTANQNKIIRQAKALQKNGLIDEAIEVYYTLFNNYPNHYEILSPLKKILKDRNNLNALNDIATKYISANKNSLKSKVDIFDIYLHTSNFNKWENILNELINGENLKSEYLNKVLGEMLNKNMLDDVLANVQIIRQTKESFFSLELAMHYSISMSIEKSLNEFFLHLKNYPQKKSFIFNRILAFPDIEGINNSIKQYLSISNDINAKILLAKIQFKQKNYSDSYDLLLIYSNNEQNIIDFIDDLIKVKEFNLAQKVINDIFNKNVSKKIIEKAIFHLAQIFEMQIINNQGEELIINNILNSELINSPFIKIHSEKSKLLDKAISIYDSLSIHTNHTKSLFQLAEIKYKILGDLDGAQKLYKKIKKNKSSKFYNQAIESLINIQISKGDLESALNLIYLKDTIKDENLKFILAVKELQIFYYQNRIDLINEKFNYFIAANNKNHIYFNDILKIKKDILLFPANILEDYTVAMQKLFQNKRSESISILEELLLTVEDTVLIDKIKLDIAYLYFLHNNFNQSINFVNTIPSESTYKEIALLFEAEIYDYLLLDKSRAANLYLLFLDSFSNSIHYELIRIRLRNLAS